MSYIEVSQTGNISGAKKFLIKPDGAEPRGYEVASEVTETLDGTKVQSVGVGSNRWSFTVQVSYAGSSGYASVADLRALFTANTAATMQMKFRNTPDSGDTTVYDVLLTNKSDMKLTPITPKWYENTSQWTCQVELAQI